MEEITDRQLALGAARTSRGLRSAERRHWISWPTAIKVALEKLPQRLRMAVYLADVEGFAYQEIPYIAGVPLSTVTSRLHRGRSQLRVLLRDNRS